MCMISVVHDHFQHEFDRSPLFPMIPAVPSTEGPSIFERLLAPKTVNITVDELEKIRSLIKDFHTACEHAAKLDVLMKQPDCVDPEKAKLKEQVVRLEKMVDELLARKA